MTNNINGIGINAGNVNPYVNPKPQGEAKTEENPEGKNPQPQGAQVKPDDVLSFMAQSAIVNASTVTAPKTYDVNKYVTPEQAARIAGFIGSFEDEVAQGLAAINDELGGANMSESAKLELAAQMAESNQV